MKIKISFLLTFFFIWPVVFLPPVVLPGNFYFSKLIAVVFILASAASLAFITSSLSNSCFNISLPKIKDLKRALKFVSPILFFCIVLDKGLFTAVEGHDQVAYFVQPGFYVFKILKALNLEQLSCLRNISASTVFQIFSISLLSYIFFVAFINQFLISKINNKHFLLIIQTLFFAILPLAYFFARGATNNGHHSSFKYIIQTVGTTFFGYNIYSFHVISFILFFVLAILSFITIDKQFRSSVGISFFLCILTLPIVLFNSLSSDYSFLAFYIALLYPLHYSKKFKRIHWFDTLYALGSLLRLELLPLVLRGVYVFVCFEIPSAIKQKKLSNESLLYSFSLFQLFIYLLSNYLNPIGYDNLANDGSSFNFTNTFYFIFSSIGPVGLFLIFLAVVLAPFRLELISLSIIVLSAGTFGGMGTGRYLLSVIGLALSSCLFLISNYSISRYRIFAITCLVPLMGLNFYQYYRIVNPSKSEILGLSSNYSLNQQRKAILSYSRSGIEKTFALDVKDPFFSLIPTSFSHHSFGEYLINSKIIWKDYLLSYESNMNHKVPLFYLNIAFPWYPIINCRPGYKEVKQNKKEDNFFIGKWGYMKLCTKNIID